MGHSHHNSNVSPIMASKIDPALVLRVFAKLEALTYEGVAQHAGTFYLGGPRCSEEALWEVCAAIMNLVSGPRASGPIVVDFKNREWEPAEIEAAHELLSWAVNA